MLNIVMIIYVQNQSVRTTYTKLPAHPQHLRFGGFSPTLCAL